MESRWHHKHLRLSHELINVFLQNCRTRLCKTVNSTLDFSRYELSYGSRSVKHPQPLISPLNCHITTVLDVQPLTPMEQFFSQPNYLRRPKVHPHRHRSPLTRQPSNAPSSLKLPKNVTLQSTDSVNIVNRHLIFSFRSEQTTPGLLQQSAGIWHSTCSPSSSQACVQGALGRSKKLDI